jgi:hypothetical protein
MWRQGDLFIAPIRTLPRPTTVLKHGVLLEGEATGHCHCVEDLGDVEVHQQNEDLYLRVVAATARIVHPEHGPITLTRGMYRVWRQREYTPERQVWVED